MISATRAVSCLAIAITCLCGSACQLRRPVTSPVRMIEPRLPELVKPATTAQNAAPVRLLDTHARAHIGRRVLHQQPGGELVEDHIWQWSSAPDRYLDTALRFELASNPGVRLVDDGRSPALAATLLEWGLVTSGETRLAGAVEFQVTNADHAVETHVVRDSEPVSAELPGNLSVAAGTLFRRLASEGVARAVRPR